MLTFIRQHTQSFVVKILAGLLIASFAVWGVGDMFTLATSSSTAIFEVGGVEVEPYEVEVEVRREVNRLAPLFGGKFGVEQAKALGIVELGPGTRLCNTSAPRPKTTKILVAGQ